MLNAVVYHEDKYSSSAVFGVASGDCLVAVLESVVSCGEAWQLWRSRAGN